MTPEEKNICERIAILESKMRQLRNELNKEHYYPELKKIQADCTHGCEVMSIQERIFYPVIVHNCKYCGKFLREKNANSA